MQKWQKTVLIYFFIMIPVSVLLYSALINTIYAPYMTSTPIKDLLIFCLKAIPPVLLIVGLILYFKNKK
jgi:hypothetical protein